MTVPPKKEHETLGGLIEEAARTADCPRCKSIANMIVPLKKVDRRMAVYACTAPGCGYTFNADGGAFIKDANHLRDVFRGATLTNRTLTESLGGEKLNPATRAVLTAQLLEYGMQMYFDGLKQGLILGCIQSEGTHEPTAAGSSAGGHSSEERAGRHAANPQPSDEPRA